MTQKPLTLGCEYSTAKRGLHIVVLYLVVGQWLGLEEFPSLARLGAFESIPIGV